MRCNWSAPRASQAQTGRALPACDTHGTVPHEQPGRAHKHEPRASQAEILKERTKKLATCPGVWVRNVRASRARVRVSGHDCWCMAVIAAAPLLPVPTSIAGEDSQRKTTLSSDHAASSNTEAPKPLPSHAPHTQLPIQRPVLRPRPYQRLNFSAPLLVDFKAGASASRLQSWAKRTESSQHDCNSCKLAIRCVGVGSSRPLRLAAGS